MNHPLLQHTFDQADQQIGAMEIALASAQDTPLAETVEQATRIVRQLITAYSADVGEASQPADDADLLECLRVLVKGDPSWNTIRDNCRELVYYHNCLQMDRADALPAHPQKMTVRTLRHLFLFMKSRCMRESRLEMS